MRLKIILLFINLTIFCGVSDAQVENQNTTKKDSTKKVELAEVSCGECQFKMAGHSCDLAVRLNGKSYFVDGTSIDQHGDAHAKDGFCETIRKAEIQGKIIDGRFKVSYFKLLPKE